MNYKKQIYYVTNASLEEIGAGVALKIKSHINELQKSFGFENVHYVSIQSKQSRLKRYLDQILFFKSIYNLEPLSSIPSNSIIYFRHTKIDFGLLKQIKKLANNNNRIIIEIPTYPYDKEANSLGSLFLLLKDKLCRKRLYNYIDKIVTYSKDKKIWNIDTINISNAINTNDNYYIDKTIDIKTINLIGVAAINFWHGYDRLIDGLHNYYINNGERNIKFHIVGDGKTLNDYKELVKKYNLENHVIFYGQVVGSDLDLIYKKCNVGVDALGRHRTGVFYNSSLKGKEYLLKGLPVVSGVETELDSRVDFKYYLRVPSNDDPVDINRIIKFYDDVYHGNAEKTKMIMKSIREFAIENFNYQVTFEPVLNYIKTII